MSKEINHLRTRLHEVELNESRRGRFEYRQPMQSTQSWHGDNQQRHAQEKGHDRRFDSIIVNRDAPGPPIPMPTSPRKRAISSEVRKRGESIEFHVQRLVERLKTEPESKSQTT